jgi:predicted amidohydrolase YtcJ
MSETAELIVVARRIITLNGRDDRPTALAIRDGRVIWVGDASEAHLWEGAGTRRHTWPDATVVPGLIDSHAHLMGLGLALESLDVRGTRSAADVAARVAAATGERPPGEWITGRGWDQNDWAETDFPDHGPLTEAAPDHPVALRRIDGHAVWLNARAMEAAGLIRETPDPQGGRIERGPDGAPTGVLVDAAMGLVQRVIPAPTRAQRRRYVERAVSECHRVGLTGVHDAGAAAETVAVYREMEAEGALPLRVHVLLDGEDPDIESLIEEGPKRGRFVDVEGVKLFGDGALGSRGAWLLAPYTDDADNRGIPIVHGQDLRARVARFTQAGFQVGVHAIGDAAARDVVDAFASVVAPGNDRRLRIEHAQVVHPDDARRMAELGILAMVQPTHATSDMDWAERRLGPARIRHAYAWRSLLAAGVRVPLGSDFPVERPHPLEGLHAAMWRTDGAGNPPGGWYPEERLTPEEALRGFTVDAAWAGFDETRWGRLAVGLAADLTVLSSDPLEAPEHVREAEVVAVMVDGRVVHRSGTP